MYSIPPDLLPYIVNINALNKEKAAFQPIEGNLSIYLSILAGFTSFQIPRTDNYIQALKRGILLGQLFWSIELRRQGTILHYRHEVAINIIEYCNSCWPCFCWPCFCWPCFCWLRSKFHTQLSNLFLLFLNIVNAKRC
jgi:hypothetical protein